MTPFNAKNYTAGGVIAPRRIVAWGATEGQVVQGAAATNALMGVSGVNGATGAGDRLDIHRSGPVDITYGGAVSQGDPLTSDAEGKAVEAAPAQGDNVRVIGFADCDAVAGDIGPMTINPFIMQGA